MLYYSIILHVILGHIHYVTYNYLLIFASVCRVARFSNVEHLSIYFPENFGNDVSRIYFIGLKGDFTQVSSDIFPQIAS